jgi:cytochrome c biogenesis protein CcdA
MDPAKRRLFAGIGGALFGFTGIFALMGALAFYLTTFMNDASAFALSGLTFILIGVALLYLFLKPTKAASKELDQLEDATADALADLPFDTLKSMVEKRPLAMTGIAALVGYTLASDKNETGTKTLQKLLFGLI